MQHPTESHQDQGNPSFEEVAMRYRTDAEKQRNFSRRDHRLHEFPPTQSAIRRKEARYRPYDPIPRHHVTYNEEVKSPPFPTNIKPPDKLYKWSIWANTLRVSLERAGISDQRDRAMELSLAAGEEVNAIILTDDLFPEIEEVGDDFPFFDFMMAGITASFERMADTRITAREFYSAKQDKGESANDFAMRVRINARKLGLSHEASITSVFINGLADPKVRRWCNNLRLSLDRSLEVATRSENGATYHQGPLAEQTCNSLPAIAAVVQATPQQPQLTNETRMKRDHSPGSEGKMRKCSIEAQKDRHVCSLCGRDSHRGRGCPARGAQCYKCQKVGHFSAVCRNARIRSIKVPSNSNKEDCQHILSFTIGGGSATECMVDSGADVDIISDKDFTKIRKEFEEGTKILYDLNYKPKIDVSGYAASSQLEVICSFKAWVNVNLDKNAPKKPRTFSEFFVVKGGGRSLMGRVSSHAMKILQIGAGVNAVTQKDDSTEEEFPSIPGIVIDFDIDESVPGVHRPYISIPAHFHEPAIERIEEMCRLKIIEEVDEPGEWLSGLNAVPKGKGDMRLVVNMSEPNKAITRRIHPMPKFEEMQLKLYGTKIFSKLDLSSAFFHLKLSKRSSQMTAFKAPSANGTKTYQFLRLVFGVNCAPEIFQREMERILEGIAGIVIYIDDILIAAKSPEELEVTTQLVMERLQANNLSINEDKCEYGKERITFLGHEVSADGFNIDKQKIADIIAFRSPRNSTELKSFLGLSNFVRGFIKNFSDLTQPLREVDGKCKFKWGPAQEEAFKVVKCKIAECTVAQGFFSTADKTELYTDASPYAIGAVLTQVDKDGNRRIISFASKSLTETEQRYPQVQREALAIVWAVEHYYYYLLGARFTIKTDADGVRFIFDRNNQRPKRFLRRAEGWAMRLNTFDYDIEFVKGIHNIADPSSRLFQTGEVPQEFGSGEMPCEIAQITLTATDNVEYGNGHMPIQQVRMETAKCKELQAVIEALESRRWPTNLHLYKSVRNDLEVTNGVLVRHGLIVPPVSLRAKAVNIAHKGHQGMSKTKSVLKEVMWWPRMYQGVEDWIAGCRTCLLAGRAEDTVPMQRTVLPEAPWDYVAMDYCGPFATFGGVHVVCIVDYHSRYTTAAIVKSTGWKHLEPVFDEVFGRFGFPATIKSDNGAPFSGGQYKEYCDKNGIERVFSFPLDPKQNGMAEASMKHVNRSAQHAAVEGTSLAKALKERIRAHNDSAHSETREVPSQVMFGRRLRRNLPTARPALVAIDTEAMRAKDKESKLKKKRSEDHRRHAKDSSIIIGDKVLLLRPDRCKGQTRFGLTEWTVKEIRLGDLTLVAPDGRETRRNITKVKKLPPVYSQLLPPQSQWPTHEEDQRPPSPFLFPAQWRPESETPDVRASDSPNLVAQRQWPTQQEDQRPPSPFLFSAQWGQGPTTAADDERSTQTPNLTKGTATEKRQKREIKRPTRLTYCVFNEGNGE